MSLEVFLSQLCEKGLDLWLEDDKLCYRAQAGAISSQELAEVKAKKQAVIELLRSGVSVSRTEAVSAGQQAIWFLQEKEPQSYAYNTAFSARVRGGIDGDLIRVALHRLQARHPILRARYLARNGSPYMRIQPFEEPLVHESNCQAKSEEELYEAVLDSYRRPFKLSEGPVIRIHLFRRTATETILLIVAHHICDDFWSLMVLVEDLIELYQSLFSNRAPSLPPLKAQYRDFVRQESSFILTPEAEKSLEFWKQHLATVPCVLDLPSDFPRPPVQTLRGASHYFAVDSELLKGVRGLASKLNVTNFVCFLSAFKILLGRYSGSHDVIVGCPNVGRTNLNVDRVVGLFINMMPIRSIMSPGMPSEHFIKTVSNNLLEGMEHAALPYAQIVSNVPHAHDPSRPPIFQAACVYHRAQSNGDLADLLTFGSKARLVRGDWTLESYLIPQGEGQFDLTLEVIEAAETSAVLRYNKDLFTAETVGRLSAHFVQVLRSMVRNPSMSVDTLPMLASHEHRALVIGFNQTGRRETAPPIPVHELFERQVARHPERVAVTCEDIDVSYAELNRQAEVVATFLRAVPIERSLPVGIFMDRSIGMLASLLGVLKAGCHYLPLDHSYPVDRIAFMLHDSGAQMVLTTDRLCSRLPDFQGKTQTIESLFSSELGEGPAVSVTSDDLMYMIYTSGSTGRPKAVQVPHSCAVNFLRSMEGTPGLTEGDTVLALTSISFDISVLELFLPLTVGARIVIAPDGAAIEPQSVMRLLGLGVTVAQMTPSSWQLLLTGGWRGDLNLTALVGGEALPATLAESLLPRTKALHNLYGPTETTVWSMHQKITSARDIGVGGLAFLGTPIDNTQVYVLDANLSPTPIGVVGELYIGGKGVARGYAGRPGLTAERFIPDQFSGEAGARLYRTGDLARHVNDGRIEFVGRSDFQVKIRGHRIECGEIERVIASHSEVREVVASTVTGRDGAQTLVAYIVPRLNGKSANGDSLASDVIAKWQTVWDEAYQKPTSSADREFNTIGWNDSAHGKEFSSLEMREWLDETIKRIAALHPKKVLEVGCGTGMILSKIAPLCDTYVALDISAEAISYVRELTDSQTRFKSVALFNKAAHELPQGTFDLVIINSVVQYFPDVDYLIEVVRTALDRLSDGGVVFLGDLRNFDLLDAYSRSVEVARSADAQDVVGLKKRSESRVRNEEELVVSPQMIRVLGGMMPEISKVKTLIRKGECLNELTRYRFDALIYKRSKKDAPSEKGVGTPVNNLSWSPGRFTKSEVKRLLQGSEGALYIRGAPNSRLRRFEVVPWSELGKYGTVGDLKQSQYLDNVEGLSPHDMWSLADELGYALNIECSSDNGALIDLIFSKNEIDLTVASLTSPLRNTQTVDPSMLASQPSRQRKLQKLSSELRAVLAEQVPPYMIPGAFMFLDSFPCTPNGKLDRKALPIPKALDTRVGGRPPINETQRTTCAIWSEVLAYEKIGIGDNFFELGGHSLLATQIVARLRERFGIDLPVRSIFEYQNVEALSALIDALLRGRESQKDETISGRALNDADVSAWQEQFWMLEQLDENAGSYNIPYALELGHPPCPAALQRAIAGLAQRYQILSRSFHLLDADTLSTVENSLSPLLEVVSVVSDGELLSSVVSCARRPFPLDCPPLWRVCLVGTGNRTVLLLVVHHIIADGRSIELLADELSERYSAEVQGEDYTTGRSVLDYEEYAGWQKRQASSFEETQIAYWKEELAGASSVVSLPFVGREAGGSNGRARRFYIREPLAGKIKKLSAEIRATPFMVLHSVFVCLLQGYSGDRDISVGIPVSKRTKAILESVIGPLVNTVVVRTLLESSASFSDLVALVFRKSLKAFDHSDIPFANVVDAVQGQRAAGGNPLFNVMFSYLDRSKARNPFADLSARTFEFDYRTAKFDLSLLIEDTGGELAGIFEYKSERLEESMVCQMIRSFETLLEAVTENHAICLHELPLLSSQDLAGILALRGTCATVEPIFFAHERIEQAAAATPDEVAVVSGSRTFSYRELNNEANKLAYQLIERGVGPGTYVGIALESSIELLVGILATLKSGAAYIPIDVQHPAPRIKVIVDDAQPALILTHSAAMTKLPPSAITLAVIIEEIGSVQFPNPCDSDRCRALLAEDPVYAIFTSGSTGQPKGVVISHAGLSRYLNWASYAYPLTQGHYVPINTSISFDATVTSLYLPLIKGCGVIVLPHEGQIHELAKVLVSNREVGLVKLTPAHLSALLEILDSNVSMVRCPTFVVGGESLSALLVNKWLSHLPGLTIVNEYGPTEAVVGCSIHRCSESQHCTRGTVSIGRPAGGTLLYVLNEHLSPVPLGVEGELYIGGEQLAEGYLRRPGLTAARFIPNPFSDGSSSRLYRTGDRVRWQTDGSMEFLGRLDDQVKIRGYRIELGEIEAALERQPEIVAAVVVEEGNTVETKRLLAFVITRKDATLTEIEILLRLEREIPAYMVPGRVFFREGFSCTPNGKVDRALLLKTLKDDGQPSQPVSEMEGELCRSFADVLGRERFGVDENFFRAGGNSLLAVRLINRLRSTWSVELKVIDIFRHPTPRLLVDCVQLSSTKPVLPLPFVKLYKAQSSSSRILSFQQERLWFLSVLDSDCCHYSVPTAIELTGSVDLKALRAAVSDVVMRHEVLQAGYEESNGTPRLVACRHSYSCVEEVIINSSPTMEYQELRSEIEKRSARNFDLHSGGALFDAVLFRLGVRRSVLFLNFHHSIFDGWSAHIFYQEVSLAYNARLSGRPAVLPPLPMQYADFAAQQREDMTGEKRFKLVEYWKGKLAGCPDVLNLSVGNSRPARQTFSGSTMSFLLDEKITSCLKEIAADSSASLFMVLETIFTVMLHRYSGQADIIVGTTLASRNQTETEGLIGCFINTLPVRVAIEPGDSLMAVLSRVRATMLELYEHQDLPFEIIVDALRPERSLSYTPIFQVMFELLNTPHSDLNFTQVQAREFDIPWTTSKFDLTLAMRERGTALEGIFEYNTGLFSPESVERMCGHFETITRSFIENPDGQVSELSILRTKEREGLVDVWNETSRKYSEEDFNALFDSAVARFSSSVAVVGTERVTYSELNRRANYIASQLVQNNASEESVIAVLSARNENFIAGIVGIFKAGAVYLPVDPSNPLERIRKMLEGAGCKTILASDTAGPGYNGLMAMARDNDLVVLNLDELCRYECTESPAAHVQISNAAYILYTSGSTGTPKGIIVEHGGFMNHLHVMIESLQLGASDVLAQTAPQGFDISVWQMTTLLLVGGKIVVVPDCKVRDPESLIEYCIEEGVTVMQLVPAMVSSVLDSLSDGSLDSQRIPSLRWMIPTGESLPVELVRRWLKAYPSVPLVNAYGPAECSDDVTLAVFQEPPGQNILNASIGRPVPNVRAYIVDGNLNPVPIGVVGELLFGGIAVGRGYCNDPRRTAEAFIPDYLSGAVGARLYRTGDLARYSPDGTIEFIGRQDSQVKIRGRRLELGEIDAALMKIDGVLECSTILEKAEEQKPCLVSFVVLRPTVELEPDRIRAALSLKLPSFMIPRVVILSSPLPRNANGKVSRSKLPLSGPVRARGRYEAPRSSRERKLCEIWSQVLGQESIGVQDNFFEIGGDSILSMQVVARANACGIKLSIKSLFEHQTIKSLAEVSAEQTFERNEEQFLESAPLTAIQIEFFEEVRSNPHHYNQAVALETVGIDQELLQLALDAVIEHHDYVRSSFIEKEGRWLNYIPRKAIRCPFDSHRLAEYESIVDRVHLEIGLSKSPLFRAIYFHSADGAADLLLLVAHHLVVDGVSWRILIEDIFTAYEQLEAGEKVRLPHKGTSFARWATRLSQWAQSDEVALGMEYWRHLAAIEPVPLPVDFPCIDDLNLFSDSDEIGFQLDVENTRDLFSLTLKRFNVGIKEVLLAPLLQSITKWTGTDFLLLDLESHGRAELFADLDLSRTVGWFTSQFPVLLYKEKVTDVPAMLKSLETQLQEVPFEGLPYGLGRYLRRDSTMRSIPIPEVSLNYLGQLDTSHRNQGRFKLATADTGSAEDGSSTRKCLLDVNAYVQGGQLLVRWTFNRRIHAKDTIKRLAQSFRSGLEEIIQSSRAVSAESISVPKSRQLICPALRPYSLTAFQSAMLQEIRSRKYPQVFFEQVAFEFTDYSTVSKLKLAWQRTLQELPILRSSFRQGETVPSQVVCSNCTAEWDELDWEETSWTDISDKLERWMFHDRLRGFDLERPPLMRFTVFKCQEAKFILVWSMSHLLLDGWSSSIVLKRVSEILSGQADTDGPTESACELPEYVSHLQRLDRHQSAAYWIQELGDWTPKRSRPNNLLVSEEERYFELVKEIPDSLSTAINEYAQASRVTLNSVMLSALGVALVRLTGVTDNVVGLSSINRPPTLRGIEKTLGLLINDVPVRLRPNMGDSLAEWVKSVFMADVRRREFLFSDLSEIEQIKGVPRLKNEMLAHVRFQNFLRSNPTTEVGGDFKVLRVVDRWPYPLDLTVLPFAPFRMLLTVDRHVFSVAEGRRLLDEIEHFMSLVALNPEHSIGQMLSENCPPSHSSEQTFFRT